MTASRPSDAEVGRVIRSWLREDRHEDVSRIAGAVLDQAATTPQRRVTWWPVRRTPIVTKMLTVGLGAAAVVVVLYVGAQLLAAPNDGVGGPDVEASPTPQPVNLPDSGSLEPGAYRINAGPFTSVQLVMTIPEGWAADRFAVVVKNAGEPTQVGMAPDVVASVFDDACDDGAGRTAIGPTAEDLVTALLAQQSIDVTAVSDTIIGGYAAQRVDLAYPDGLDAESCPNVEHLRIWADEAETLFFELGANETASVYAADVAGRRVVVTTVTGPEATPADVAERDGIIRSMQLFP